VSKLDISISFNVKLQLSTSLDQTAFTAISSAQTELVAKSEAVKLLFETSSDQTAQVATSSAQTELEAKSEAVKLLSKIQSLQTSQHIFIHVEVYHNITSQLLH
jgi:hypothetical protein